MSTPTPTRMLCLVAEHVHVCSAATHHYGLLHIPDPYGGMLEGTVIVPLITLGVREIIPGGCFILSYVLRRLADALDTISKLPSFVGTQLTDMRLFAGRKLGEFAFYLQRRDLED